MKKEALVVGINSYPFFEEGDLKAPAKDAEDLAQILEQYGGFKVTRLPNICREGKWEVNGDDSAQVKADELQEAISNLFHQQFSFWNKYGLALVFLPRNAIAKKNNLGLYQK